MGCLVGIIFIAVLLIFAWAIVSTIAESAIAKIPPKVLTLLQLLAGLAIVIMLFDCFFGIAGEAAWWRFGRCP